MRRHLLIVAALTLAASAEARASVTLPDLDAGVGAIPDSERKEIEAAFLTTEKVLGVDTLVARPTKDTYARMKAIVAKHDDVAGEAYLAEAATRAGDFAAAEQAWKKVGHAPWALERLADFYAERLEPAKELTTLDALAAAMTKEQPVARDQLRAVYERAVSVMDAHALAGDRVKYRRAIAALYPDDLSYLRRWLDEMVEGGDHAGARAQIAWARKIWPHEERTFTRLEAALLVSEGKDDDAIALHRKLLSSDPTAPDMEVRWADFYDLLSRTNRLSGEKATLLARTAVGPIATADLVALFELDLHTGAGDDARKLLDNARAAHAPTDVDALLYARLRFRLGDVSHAIRGYYAAATSTKTPAVREEALLELGVALLEGDAPRNALTPLDPWNAFAPSRWATRPSLAGGLLSLVFDSRRKAESGSPGDDLMRVADAWLNGSRAEEVLGAVEKDWPKDPSTLRLAMRVLGFEQAYGRHDAVIALTDHMLATWPDAPEAIEIAIAGAAARRLRGDVAGSDRAFQDALARAEKRDPAEAERVLELYVADLTEEHRQADAVRVLWAEVDRTPRDPEPYDRLVDYLEQSGMFEQELDVYRRALKQFPDGASWNEKLARYYVRRKGVTAFRELTEKLVGTLRGTEAEAYLTELVPPSSSFQDSEAPRFYEAIYKMANDRFPARMTFVYALLRLYDDDPARRRDAEALIRRYAIVDSGMRARLVEIIASHDDVDATLAQLVKPKNDGEKLIAADLRVWASQQEQALPLVKDLLADWPEDRELARRAASLTAASGHADDPKTAHEAVAILDGMHHYYPGEPEWSDTAGSLLAEIADLDGAKHRWNALVTARPGDAQVYVALAGATWDYYLFDDAAGAITEARRRMHDPLLFWDRMGGIDESKKDRGKAAREYVAAWIDDVGRTIDAASAGPAWDADVITGSGSQIGMGGNYGPIGGDSYGGDGDGDEGAGGWAASLHGADASPGEKLSGLNEKTGGKEAIAKAFQAIAGERVRDFRPGIAEVRWLRQEGDVAGAKRTLAALIEKHADEAKALRAAIEITTENKWRDVEITARRKLAQKGARSPELVLALADALERDGQVAAAAKEYDELTARLEKNGAPGEVRSDTHLRLAAFDERHGQQSAAFTERRRAADALAGDARDDLLFDLAARYLAAKKPADATPILVDLRARRPRDLRSLDLLGDLAVQAKDEPGLTKLYTQAIEGVKKLATDDEDKKQLVAAVRRSHIARLERLGLHADAIDQWIEVVNRDPENKENVLAAVEYGRRHGQVKRFVAAMEKNEAASAKDVHWPIVLGWAHEAAGETAPAAKELARAIEIRPDRIELRIWQAADFSAAGDFDSAEKAYAALYELADQDPSYLFDRAQALARLGRRDPLIATLREYVARTSSYGTQRYRQVADVLAGAGFDAEALGWDHIAIQEAMAQPAVVELDPSYVEDIIDTAVRAGRGKEVLAELETLRAVAAPLVSTTACCAAANTSTGIDRATTAHLFDIVATRALDQDAKELLPFVLTGSRRLGPNAMDELYRRARDADLIDLAVALVDEQRKAAGGNNAQRERWDAELLGLYENRSADRLLVDRFMSDRSLHRIELYPTAWAAARRLGDRDRELAILAEYWDLLGTQPELGDEKEQFERHDALVARYLDLLAAKKDHPTIEKLAARGTVSAGQVIDYLFAAGDNALAVKAIGDAATALQQTNAWRASRTAIALTRAGDVGTKTRALYEQALGRRTLGAKAPDPGDALEGPGWYAFAFAYGRVLASDPKSALRAEDYVLAETEAHPRAADAQNAVGEAFLAGKDPQRAERHFELALSLSPNDWQAIDGLARAQLAAGDRDAALATWDRIRTQAGAGVEEQDHAQIVYARALAASKLTDEARTALEKYVESRWATLDGASGPPLVMAIAELHPSAADRAAGGPLDTWLRARLTSAHDAWLDAAVLGVYWEAAAGYGDPDRAQDATVVTTRPIIASPALEPYYRDALALAHAADDEATTRIVERGYLEWLAHEEQWSRAIDVAKQLIAARRAAPVADGAVEPVPLWLDLALADAYLGAKQPEDARKVIEARLAITMYGQELAEAQALFVRRGQTRMGGEIVLSFYDKHADGRLFGADEWRTIAAARLDTGDQPGAMKALDAAIALAPIAEGGPVAAAEVLEGHHLEAKAVAYRERARAMAPRDAVNRLALAKDQIVAGDHDGAVAMAAGILGDRGADRLTRESAASVIRDLVAASPDVAPHALKLLEARADATPFDESTFVALSYAARGAGKAGDAQKALEHASAGAFLPRLVLLAQGDQALADGDVERAIPLYERALLRSRGDRGVHVALFHARRKAGVHEGAIGALELGGVVAYRGAGPTADGREARVKAVDTGVTELDGTTALEAADSARKAGDRMAAAFYLNVASRLATSQIDAKQRKAEAVALLEAEIAAQAKSEKSYVSFEESF
jgi:Flp pilus assembly protein TadD